MQLEISNQERDLLLKILSDYKGNLRAEIYRTETSSFKNDLKHEEALLEGVLSRLQPAAAEARP